MNDELKGLFDFVFEELLELGYSLDSMFVVVRELEDKPISVHPKPFVNFCVRKI